jgi:hypothetical protein
VERGVKIGIPKVFEIGSKSRIEQKFQSISKSLLHTSTNEMHHEVSSWLRQAIYDIDFNYIPDDIIQAQLEDRFKQDLLSMPPAYAIYGRRLGRVLYPLYR